MFELFAFFAKNFVWKQICPNLIVGEINKKNSLQQDHSPRRRISTSLRPISFIRNGASSGTYMTALLFASRLVRRWLDEQ
jgi:hypothetical protein